MGPGRFVVCMAQEPHLPSAAAKRTEKIKKCVIKVAVGKTNLYLVGVYYGTKIRTA